MRRYVKSLVKERGRMCEILYFLAPKPNFMNTGHSVDLTRRAGPKIRKMSLIFS